MNLAELPALMREHAEHDSVPVLADSRINGIQRKVAAAHRRRVGGAVAALIAVALVSVGWPILHLVRGGAVRAAAPTTKMINGFPEYESGGKLVETRTANLNAGPITFTYTPTYDGIVTSNACTPVPTDVEIEVHVLINGHDVASMGCLPNVGGAYQIVNGSEFTSDGLAVGIPATITFTATAYRQTMDKAGNEVRGKTTEAPLGTYAVAIWQRLPFDQYPLPRRPKVLPKLDLNRYGIGGANGTVVTMMSKPSDPLAAQTLTFTMPTCPASNSGGDWCVSGAATSQTPGSLAVTVNGVPIVDAEFWDYQGGGWGFDLGPDTPGLHLKPGQPVIVTVTPLHVTGAWEVGIGTDQ